MSSKVNIKKPRVRSLNCCAINCCKTSVNNPELAFFTVPQQSRERREEWLILLRREDLIEKETLVTGRVCEEHFAPEDILLGSHRKILKRNAVPSRRLPEQMSEIVRLEPRSPELHTPNPSDKIVKLASKLTQTNNDMEDIINLNDHNSFFDLCDIHLPKELAQIIKAKKSFPYNNWNLLQNDPNYKPFCLKLYETSPHAYQFLKSFVQFPLTATLPTKRSKCLQSGTGTKSNIMSTLIAKVDKMTPKQKICSVLIGSMSLKANLCYNIKQDKIIGFQEINAVQIGEPATKVLVVMVRGIFSNWKLPIDYALLSENGDKSQISNWIDDLIIGLFGIGLTVRAFTSTTNDDYIAKSKSVSPAKPYFIINDKKIYYIFDAPDLIKSMRDSFLSNDFHFQGRIAKHEHIVQFFNEDQKKTMPVAKKLTNSHISPTKKEKKQGKLAAQLFSRSVASGLWNYINFKVVAESGRDTVEFISNINNLFDTLNTSKSQHADTEYKKAFSGEETQCTLFDEMFILFQSLKVISRNGQDVTLTAKFIQGFSITIKSILFLFNDLKNEGHSFLLTRNLSREALDIALEKLKVFNGKSLKLTALKFMSAYKNLLLYYQKKAKLGTNSKGKLKELLDQINILEAPMKEAVLSNLDINDTHAPSTNELEHPQNLKKHDEVQADVVQEDYKEIDTPEKHSLFYICGLLFMKSRQKCKECDGIKDYIIKSYERSNIPTQYLEYQKYRKKHLGTLLGVPCDEFYRTVLGMEKKFVEIMERKQINIKITESIYNEMKTISYVVCSCFPMTYMIKLFIRIRIFYTIRANNRGFRRDTRRMKHFTVPRLS